MGKTLTIELKYGPNRERSIAGIRRVSQARPAGLRQVDQPAAVLGGLGVAILSTSSGLLTDRQAPRRAWVGKSSPTSGKGGSRPCRASVDSRHRAHRRRRHHRRPAPSPSRAPRAPCRTPWPHPIAVASARTAPSPSPARTTSGVSRSLHGLTRTLIANMVDRRDRRLREEARDRRHRLPRRGQGLGPGVRARLQPPDHGRRRRRASPSPSSRPDRGSACQGIDKQQVGEVAANIRKLRKPDPYKGKGVRYAGEQVRRKVGKAGK